MNKQPAFKYGGCVIDDGVMIYGVTHYAIAVRRPDGSILSRPGQMTFWGGVELRRLPFLRGILSIVDTFMLDVKSTRLTNSLSCNSEDNDDPAWITPAMLVFGQMAVGVFIFLLIPALLAQMAHTVLQTDILVNVLECMLRVGMIMALLWVAGRSKHGQLIFSYHGAEHMAIHTHEAGKLLSTNNVREFDAPHPRCGTAFLLIALLVSSIVFVFLPRPTLIWLVVSRVELLPLIICISYEIMRFCQMHQGYWVWKQLVRLCLLMQLLTTRQPSDDQIEVAITAMQLAINANETNYIKLPDEDCDVYART